MAVFHMEMKSTGGIPLSEPEAQFRKPIYDCECVFGITRALPNGEMRLLVFEQYFYRAKGTITLTLQLTDAEGTQTADLVASGGGEGLSYSFGACRSFVKWAAGILQDYGFRDTNPEPERNLPRKILDYFFD